jgi:predicted transposase/invertase (TIGR01784 family)
MKKKRPIPNPHDAFFRRIFGRPEVAAEFFRLYLPPEVAERLDLSWVKLEDASFVDEKLREHFSDLLFRVGLKDGGEAFIYILLEHKSAPDERVALQLLRYVAQAWDRLPAPLPLIVPVVVYHGAKPWRVEKSLSGLFDPMAKDRVWRRYLPDFEYYLCDLSRYSDEELKGAEGLSAALKLLKHIFRRDLSAKLPDVFIETVRDLPEQRAQEQMTTMVSYLTESQRITEAQISEALYISKTEGGPMEDVLERIVKKHFPKFYRQEGAAEFALRQLRFKVGALDQEIERRIRALPMGKLTQLGESLLDFESRDDLEKWLRRNSPAAKRARRGNGAKSQSRKKAKAK